MPPLLDWSWLARSSCSPTPRAVRRRRRRGGAGLAAHQFQGADEVRKPRHLITLTLTAGRVLRGAPSVPPRNILPPPPPGGNPGPEAPPRPEASADRVHRPHQRVLLHPVAGEVPV